MVELSVVLISKDQEWNIARLVESVLRETHHIPETEVVLVDSASKDRTTEIAARYPIKVLKLHPDQPLSASAGRYIGYNHTKGDLILFLDGDMKLCEGWLDQALAMMHTKPDVAVVCGLVLDRPMPPQDGTAEPVLPDPGLETDAVEVPHGGGAALYRRSVLEEVGTFNPYLSCDEEPELCLRIRHARHRVICLSRPIVFHLDPWRDSTPAEALSTLLGKRRARLFLGFGQTLRYFLRSPLLWSYLKERGWVVAPALMLSTGIAAAMASVLTHQWGWLVLWFGLMTLLVIGNAVRKHSLKRALVTLLRRLLILEGTLHGLLMKPNDPSEYPGRFDVVSEGHNQSCESKKGSGSQKAYAVKRPTLL